MRIPDDNSRDAGPPVVFYDAQWKKLSGVVKKSLVKALSASVNRELYEWNCALAMVPGGNRPELNYNVRTDHLTAGTSLLESWRSPVVEGIAHDPSLLRCVASILDVPVERVFCHPNKVLRAVPPESLGRGVPPAGTHIDFIELQGSSNQITVWIPLAPVDEASGVLPMYETRGRFGEFPQLSLTSENLSGWEVSTSFIEEPVYEELDTGDALCFSTFTVHGGSKNLSSSFRTSLEIRYQPIDDPIAEPSLRPYVSSSWEEHYFGWGSEYRWYWKNCQPPSVPFDPCWERWRDVESLRTDIPLARRVRALEIASSFSPIAQIRDAAATQLAAWAGLENCRTGHTDGA